MAFDEEKMKSVIAKTLSINKNEIDESSSMENIESWDSLAHMKLIVGLEEEFNVTFDEDDIIRIVSYEEIKKVLTEKM